MPTYTQSVIGDGWTNAAAGQTTKTYPTLPYLALDNSPLRRGFVYFNRAFPLGYTVASAKLRFWQRSPAASASRIFSVQLIAGSWSTGTLRHTNQPAVTGPVASSATLTGAGTAGRLIEIDVTALMQLVADGQPFYGFRIVCNNDLIYLNSKEATSLRPQLEVEVYNGPDAPERLVPAEGRAVMVARPTLLFDFDDIFGDTTMQAYQIQFFDDAGMASLVADTGWVSSAVPQHPMTFDIAVGQVLYWHVRVRDGGGLASAYSALTSFTRIAVPTLTITSPAASPNDYVEDPSPPISWTLTGATQVAYQVLITDPNDPSDILYDSTQRPLADNAVTPPADDLQLVTGQTYRLEVRVWPDVEKEATPGDPLYLSATRNFTFQMSATVDPVATLVAGQDGVLPWNKVTWTDPTQPDAVVVLRDAKVIKYIENVEDYLVSGITYEFIDNLAAPSADHTYIVARIVNNVTSSANPSAVADAFTPVGAWITTVDRSHYVWISGKDPIDWDPDEDSNLVRPLGAKNPSIVTGTIMGREGKLDGFAKPHKGQSYADMATHLKAMLNTTTYPRGTKMVLILVDEVTSFFWWDTVADHKHEYVDKIPLRAKLHELV